MAKELEIMATIQNQKEKEIENEEPQELNAEGVALAEHKRFTFDVVDVPTDPLR